MNIASRSLVQILTFYQDSVTCREPFLVLKMMLLKIILSASLTCNSDVAKHSFTTSGLPETAIILITAGIWEEEQESCNIECKLNSLRGAQG